MDNSGFEMGREEVVHRRMAIFTQGRLKDEERRFLDLIKEGDILNMKALLKDNPSINVNSFDIRGSRALEIAIQKNDPSMLLELLSLPKIDVDHVYGAIIAAIRDNQLMNVNLLLESPQATRAATERPLEYPNIVVNNITPLMVACIEQKLEIAKLLLDKGHYIDKPHEPACKCIERCNGGVAKEEHREELSEAQLNRNAFRALASPTYIILTSNDPVLSAFILSQELVQYAHSTPEFQEDFRQLSNQCSEFAAAILDQCKTTNEVQTVLMQTRGFPESRPFRFPRLYLAILLEQKDFVSHPNCQQVLKSLWIEGLPDWPKWNFFRKTIHIALQVLLTPILGLMYLVFPNPRILHNLRVPMNRFVYNATSYVIFILLILVSIFYGRRDAFKLRALWSEVLVGVWIAGYVWDIILSMWALGLKIYMRSMWAVYDLCMFTMFFIAEICWFIVFVSARTVRENLDRQAWPPYHPYLIGEAIFAVATVMAICRFLQWCQLNRSIGPLGISLKYMAGDVARFLLIILIVFFAFAAGLNSIYRNYSGNVLSTRNQFNQVKRVTQNPAFTTFGQSLKSLFWGMYAMGSPDYAEIVVAGNYSDYGPHTSYVKHTFTEIIGYGLWALYHIITVIVLLNMLIAMMSNSFERIQGNAYKEWMFARSSQWISFFDLHSSIPPPFNLFPTAYCLRVTTEVGRALLNRDIKEAKKNCSAERSCFQDYDAERTRQKEQQEAYQTLILHLVRRYLQSQDLIEREWMVAFSRNSRPISALMPDFLKSTTGGAAGDAVTASGVRLRRPVKRPVSHYFSPTLTVPTESTRATSQSQPSTPI